MLHITFSLMSGHLLGWDLNIEMMDFFSYLSTDMHIFLTICAGMYVHVSAHSGVNQSLKVLNCGI